MSQLLSDLLAQRAPRVDEPMVRDLSDLCAHGQEGPLLVHLARVRYLPKYLRDFSAVQIAEHLQLLAMLREDRPVMSAIREAEGTRRFDVVVAGYDMVGVSACVTGSLAELGLAIIEIDVVTYEPAVEAEDSAPSPSSGRSIMSLQVIQSVAGDNARQLSIKLQNRLLAAYWHLARGQLQAALDETDITDELVGTIIDERYRLERFLAQGGMGKVYLATQVDLDRQVVVKLLRSEYTREEGFVESLLREARLLAQVRSFHVVSVYATGLFQEQCWMALEHLAGGDVGRWMQKHGVPSGPLAARWMRDALRGLVYIHRDVGLIHCDIKPTNMLLDVGLNAKLSDLGLSQLHRDARASEDGKIRGTLWYMSPEQSRGEALDERSDLFSLGSTFYHILSGEAPYNASTAAEILARVGRGDHVPLGLRSPSTSPALAAIVERLMQPDPLRRYQEAAVALADLESYLGRSRILSAGSPLSGKLPDTTLHVPRGQQTSQSANTVGH
ncbi:MAG: serine/threonine-protein kinase [Pirellulales bacterium]